MLSKERKVPCSQGRASRSAVKLFVQDWEVSLLSHITQNISFIESDSHFKSPFWTSLDR